MRTGGPLLKLAQAVDRANSAFLRTALCGRVRGFCKGPRVGRQGELGGFSSNRSAAIGCDTVLCALLLLLAASRSDSIQTVCARKHRQSCRFANLGGSFGTP
jgi:hypothetical protein